MIGKSSGLMILAVSLLAISILFALPMIQSSYEQTNSYRFYVEPLPDWGDYAKDVIEKSAMFWEKNDTSLEFNQVFSQEEYYQGISEESNFAIEWIKDFGGKHTGLTFGDFYVQVSLGDSYCLDNWKPYHPDHVFEITAHEIGHVLGYGHSTNPDDIMSAGPGSYLVEEYQFNIAPNYVHFIPLCTYQKTTSYDFTVTVDDPNGLDVYFVPNRSEYENYWVSQDFNYYSDSNCFATNVVDYSGTCSGVSRNGGLLIIPPEQLSKPLTTVSVTLQEKVLPENLVENLNYKEQIIATPGFELEEQEIFPSNVVLEIDKNRYQVGESLLISGKLTDLQNDESVSLVITDPKGQIVSKVRLETTEEGEFQSFTGIPAFFQSGSYKISAYDNSGHFLADSSFAVGAAVKIPKERPWYEPIPEFKTYQNDKFSFSINYPEDWGYDDRGEDYGMFHGAYERVRTIVEFYNDIHDWKSGVWIVLSEGAVDPEVLEGQEYVDDLIEELRWECNVASYELEGYICSNHAIIDSKILEIDGREAYQVTQAWTETYPDETSYRQIRVTTDVPVGNNDYWTIDSYTIASEYPRFVELLNSVTDSFKFTTVEVQTLKEFEPESEYIPEEGGGCLIATAAYGSELAPQVQQLREIRDNSLLQTESGSIFMESFNQFYYSFSPTIADLERENPVFKEAVKLTITPLLSSLSLLNYVDMDSEIEVLGYGISLILLNVGMYFVAPAIFVIKIRRLI